jgi:nitroreductase
MPIEQDTRKRLHAFVTSASEGPFGTHIRFQLVAATEQDSQTLRGLGTYGFIKGATGFIVGAMREGIRNLEDYGYLLECIVLYATDLGLGTCWLGGSFTKSRFADKIGVTAEESVPAVAAVGYAAKRPRRLDAVMRQGVGSDQRQPWEQLFFAEQFGWPLSRQGAGAYAAVLDMVRLGPSASNRQPWRIVQEGKAWHLYLQRTRGYGGGILSRFMQMADIQRIDMGIAMSHFELTANELGLAGSWQLRNPDLEVPDDLTEYIVTWQAGEG